MPLGPAEQCGVERAHEPKRAVQGPAVAGCRWPGQPVSPCFPSQASQLRARASRLAAGFRRLVLRQPAEVQPRCASRPFDAGATVATTPLPLSTSGAPQFPVPATPPLASPAPSNPRSPARSQQPVQRAGALRPRPVLLLHRGGGRLRRRLQLLLQLLRAAAGVGHAQRGGAALLRDDGGVHERGQRLRRVEPVRGAPVHLLHGGGEGPRAPPSSPSDRPFTAGPPSRRLEDLIPGADLRPHRPVRACSPPRLSPPRRRLGLGTSTRASSISQRARSRTVSRAAHPPARRAPIARRPRAARETRPADPARRLAPRGNQAPGGSATTRS